MTSPFSINNLLFPLTKGDTPGHPFHGNQWIGAGTAQASINLMGGVVQIYNAYATGQIDNNQLKSLFTNGKYDSSESGTIIGQHTAISSEHNQIAEDMGGGNNFVDGNDFEENHNPDANAHEDAGQAHILATQAARNVISTIDNNGSKSDIISALQNYISEASVANSASLKADSTTPKSMRPSLS